MKKQEIIFFRIIQINLSELEKKGVFIPVLFQSVNYNKSVKYHEKIRVTCVCKKFNGVKLEFLYEFYNLDTNEICAIGTTSHGFIDSNFEPILFKNEYNILKKCIKS